MVTAALRRIPRLVQDEFWLFLLASLAMAFVFPEFGRTWLKPLALPAILAQMYVVMLNIRPAELAAAVRAWRPLARALAFLFLLTPPLALLARLGFGPEIALGFAIVCTLPSGMSSPFFALRFGGDAALAVVVTAVSHLLLPLVAPIWVSVLASSSMEVDPVEIFVRLLQLVVLPFALAALTRWVLGERRTGALYERTSWLGGVFIMIVTWGIVAEITVTPVPLAPVAGLVLALNGALYAAGYLLGGEARRTTTMTSGYRNVTLGMVLALSVWGDPRVALPSVVWTLTHTVYAVLLLFLHRRGARGSAETIR